MGYFINITPTHLLDIRSAAIDRPGLIVGMSTSVLQLLCQTYFAFLKMYCMYIECRDRFLSIWVEIRTNWGGFTDSGWSATCDGELTRVAYREENQGNAREI